MATQIKDSSANHVAQEHVVKPRFNWPLITIAALIVTLIIGFLIVGIPAAENQTNVQRANEADTARYSGLAAYYLAENETNRQRAVEAEAARYSGLAEFFTAGK